LNFVTIKTNIKIKPFGMKNIIKDEVIEILDKMPFLGKKIYK
jgi:hypothetical protein